MAMNVKKGDTVIVLSGKDKGKQGKVLGTVPSEAKVVVEGINMVTCHVKPRRHFHAETSFVNRKLGTNCG